MSPAQLLSKWVGETEQNLAAVFERARAQASALIFMDEIDGFGINRDGDGPASPIPGLLTQLLTELDGCADVGQGGQARVRFLAASNQPWAVDAALMRPGRLDAHCYVRLPDAQARKALLAQRLKGVPTARRLNLADVAEAAQGCSGAEVAAVADEAMRMAFLRSVEAGGRSSPVSQDDLMEAAHTVHRAATPDMLARFKAFGQA